MCKSPGENAPMIFGIRQRVNNDPTVKADSHRMNTDNAELMCWSISDKMVWVSGSVSPPDVSGHVIFSSVYLIGWIKFRCNTVTQRFVQIFITYKLNYGKMIYMTSTQSEMARLRFSSFVQKNKKKCSLAIKIQYPSIQKGVMHPKIWCSFYRRNTPLYTKCTKSDIAYDSQRKGSSHKLSGKT